MHELVTKADLVFAVDTATNKLAIRLGSLIFAGVAILANLAATALTRAFNVPFCR